MEFLDDFLPPARCFRDALELAPPVAHLLLVLWRHNPPHPPPRRSIRVIESIYLPPQGAADGRVSLVGDVNKVRSPTDPNDIHGEASARMLHHRQAPQACLNQCLSG